MLKEYLNIEKFINDHWDQKSPLLLGYSGGPDSKALLYLLLDAGVKPQVAHVDHGWRPESGAEAYRLSQEIEQLGLIFHTTRLENVTGEEGARIARLNFFKTLAPFQALLLAHQGDDLAETALKRVFEGAYLPFLGGMEPVSSLEGIPIWRPLLHVRKHEIFRYLEEKGLQALQDPTNEDPVYLRARMRLKIFPFLNQTFGKEITENLICLGKRAAELKHYLDKKVEDAEVEESDIGKSVNLIPYERIERRHLLQLLARKFGISFPRSVLENILDWVEERAPKRRINVQSREIWIDRGLVVFVASDLFSVC